MGVARPARVVPRALARSCGAGRRADELRSLISGPSIELARSQVPLAERDLLGSSEVAVRCTADQLLERMSDAFDGVKIVVAEFGEAWNTLTPRLTAAREMLDQTHALAASLGESQRTDLNEAGDRLARLSAALTSDPLSVAPGTVDRLIDSLDAIRRDLEATAALRRDLDARLADSRALLVQLHGGRRGPGRARGAARQDRGPHRAGRARPARGRRRRARPDRRPGPLGRVARRAPAPGPMDRAVPRAARGGGADPARQPRSDRGAQPTAGPARGLPGQGQPAGRGREPGARPDLHEARRALTPRRPTWRGSLRSCAATRRSSARRGPEPEVIR